MDKKTSLITDFFNAYQTFSDAMTVDHGTFPDEMRAGETDGNGSCWTAWKPIPGTLAGNRRNAQIKFRGIRLLKE